VTPDQVFTAEGLGLPFHKTPYKFGNLFIKFNIKFPDQLNASQMEAAKTILSSQQKSAAELKEIQSTEDKVQLVKFQEHHKNTHVQGGTEAHGSEDEDEEHEGQNVRVGCP
jgi:DnaJ-class molecular chaperone